MSANAELIQSLQHHIAAVREFIDTLSAEKEHEGIVWEDYGHAHVVSATQRESMAREVLEDSDAQAFNTGDALIYKSTDEEDGIIEIFDCKILRRATVYREK